MILRRVIAHFKKQEWTAIAIDFVIVVVGVFVGLQVNNWNAGRIERRAEIGYLAAMEEDIVFSIEKLETLISQMERQETARAALYAYSVEAGATIDPKVRDRAIAHGLFHLATMNIRQVAYEALKGSGRLGAIGSPALISALQALSTEVTEVVRREQVELQVTYLFSDPLLMAGVDMAGVFRQPNLAGRPPAIGWLPDAKPSSITPEVMKSTAFRNAVLYRSYFTGARLIDVKRVLEGHRRIALLIDARQAELGGNSMILRRVIAHFKKQEWTAIFLDFVIVVAGVFMGFQITDLAGRRADREAERRHLEEIAEDLRADLDKFKQIRIGARARIGAVDYLLREARNEALPDQIVLSTDTFAALGEEPDPEGGRSNLLGRANLVRTTYGNRTGFEALIGSGDLKLIRDRTIGRQIQKYYASFDDIWSTWSMMREIRNDGAATGYALGLSAFGEVAEEQLIDIVRGSDAYAAYLKTSREWAAIQLDQVDEQASRASALLTSIDEYLDGRGEP